MTNILITGTAGFIGYHLAALLLNQGHKVHGYDGITDYYDTGLKRHRHQLLAQHTNFSFCEAMLEDMDALVACAESFEPDVIVHLAVHT